MIFGDYKEKKILLTKKHKFLIIMYLFYFIIFNLCNKIYYS